MERNSSHEMYVREGTISKEERRVVVRKIQEDCGCRGQEGTGTR